MVGDAVLRSAGRRPERSKTACGELRGGEIPQRGMRPSIVVFLSVLLAQHFCLQLASKRLHVEEFIPKPTIETFTVGVLPWRSWLDVEGLHSSFLDPRFHRLGNELGAIVGADKLGRSPLIDDSLQDVNHIGCRDRAFHFQRKALPGVFIQDWQPLEPSTAFGLIPHKVVAPHVVLSLRPHPLRPVGRFSQPTPLARFD